MEISVDSLLLVASPYHSNMGNAWALLKETMEQKHICTLLFYINLKAADFFQWVWILCSKEEKIHHFLLFYTETPNTVTQFSTTHVAVLFLKS